MKPSAWAALLAAALLAGCLQPDGSLADGPGSETVGLQGTALRPDGGPAQFFHVVVRPADYLMGSPAETRPGKATVTDIWGRYHLELAPGAYSVEITDHKALAALVRCTLTTGMRRHHAPQTRVAPWATLKGEITLPEGATESDVLVRIYGLDRRVYTDPATGKFALTDLPAGDHVLNFLHIAPILTSLDVKVEVDAGSWAAVKTTLPDQFADEDYSSWPYSRSLRIRTATVGVQDSYINFPLMVKLDASNFPFDSASSRTGEDIRFSAPDGRHLAYEIESWNAAARQALIWVRADVAGNDDAQSIRMHWGKSGVRSFSSGPTVFRESKGFRGVWHLDESVGAPSPQFHDASVSGNHMTGVNPAGIRSAASNIRAGLELTPGSSLVTATPSEAPQGFTMGMWFRATGGGPLAIYEEADASGGGWRSDRGIWLDEAGAVHFGVHAGPPGPAAARSHVLTSAPGYHDGKWHAVCVVLSSEGQVLYLDGALAARDAAVTRSDEFTGSWRLAPAELSGWEPEAPRRVTTVAVEEVRTGLKPPSLDWIKLTYESQREGTSLVEFVVP